MRFYNALRCVVVAKWYSIPIYSKLSKIQLIPSDLSIFKAGLADVTVSDKQYLRRIFRLLIIWLILILTTECPQMLVLQQHDAKYNDST